MEALAALADPIRREIVENLLVAPEDAGSIAHLVTFACITIRRLVSIALPFAVATHWLTVSHSVRTYYIKSTSNSIVKFDLGADGYTGNILKML
jgi:hypothetical protein